MTQSFFTAVSPLAKTMPAELRTERRNQTLVLTISDPATRNTLSPQVCDAGVEALGVAESNPELRCVVITGDADHFCAGGNLQRLAANRELGREAQRAQLAKLNQLVEAIRAFPKPVIAAAEGVAAGAGFSLALACDLVVAAQDAKFIMAYNKVGLSPDGGATWHLMQALPRALALQLIWLAEPASAQQLQQLGLVNRVTDKGRALDEALRMADTLAGFAAGALASGKELVNNWPQHTLGAQLGAEQEHFVQNLFDANGGEGLQAFFDKRAPRFG
jgi:enoyl-CoA hydratase/carnithine racemase